MKHNKGLWLKAVIAGFVGALICMLIGAVVYGKFSDDKDVTTKDDQIVAEDGDQNSTSDDYAEGDRNVNVKRTINSGLEYDSIGIGTLSNPSQPIVSVVQKANPAVVSIVISEKPTWYQKLLLQEEGKEFSLQDFILKKIYGEKNLEFKSSLNPESDFIDVGGGSGFFVTSDGLIVTNKHVVSEEDAKYRVFTYDGEEYPAYVVARDPQYDIALIRVVGEDFPKLTLANSDYIRVGQTAIAIGNALGEFQNSVSAGVISGLGRTIEAGDAFGDYTEVLSEVIQTDAAINLGNSGGPLLNIAGQVVGINVAIVDGSQNIGFAIPSNQVIDTIDSVERTGKIDRPYLGVTFVQLTRELITLNNIKVGFGAIVYSEDESVDAVAPNSAADKAGIKQMDIITRINGDYVSEFSPLDALIAQYEVGDTITITLVRDGKEMEVEATLGSVSDEL